MKLARFRGATRVVVSGRQTGAASGLGWAPSCRQSAGRDLAAVVQAESDRRGADVVIVAAPSKPAQESALAIAAIGGRINFFGGLPKQDPFIRFDSNAVHYKELVVTGTTACSTYDCLRAAEIVRSGRIELAPLVTARFPLAEANTAFAAAADGTNLRVVLEP